MHSRGSAAPAVLLRLHRVLRCCTPVLQVCMAFDAHLRTTHTLHTRIRKAADASETEASLQIPLEDEYKQAFGGARALPRTPPRLYN